MSGTLNKILKNRMKRKISNNNICGVCSFLGERVSGKPTGFCTKKKKDVSVINFELRDPWQVSCFNLRTEEIKWLK